MNQVKSSVEAVLENLQRRTEIVLFSYFLESYGKEQVSRDTLIPCVLRIPASLDIHDNPLVTSSTVILQTKASCLPPFFLMAKTNPKERFDVIDATAAPGNKTTFLGDLLRDRGTVFAFDRDAKRFQILSQRCEAFGSGNVVVLRVESRTDRMHSRKLSRNGSFLAQIPKREVHSGRSFLQWQRNDAYVSRYHTSISPANPEPDQVSVAMHRARGEVSIGASHQLFDVQCLQGRKRGGGCQGTEQPGFCLGTGSDCSRTGSRRICG